MQSSPRSCCKIRANLLKNGKGIITSTVSRCLSKKFGLKFYKPAAKPRCTAAIEN